MTIYTNNTLTINDRKVIRACLDDYRSICLDDAGEDNIMGLTFKEDKTVELRSSTKLWKTVDEIIDRVMHDRMLDDDFSVIYRCFDDALDQFASCDENDVIGFITSAEDKATVESIYHKLQHNGERQIVMEDMKMLPLIADALVGHFGANISDYTVCSDMGSDSVRNYLSGRGMTIGAEIEPIIATMAWAMAILGVRDLTDDNVRDKVYDLGDELSEII